MSEIWLTADTHFNHDAILTYCERPFPTVHAMNEHLIAGWNARVHEDDYVIHVGDVAMGYPPDMGRIIARLKGRVLLIVGNHDILARRRVCVALGWRHTRALLVNDVLFQHLYVGPEHDYEAVIHGHAHGTYTADRHYDVGVDVGGWERDALQCVRPADMYLSRRDSFALRAILRMMWA